MLFVAERAERPCVVCLSALCIFDLHQKTSICKHSCEMRRAAFLRRDPMRPQTVVEQHKASILETKGYYLPHTNDLLLHHHHPRSSSTSNIYINSHTFLNADAVVLCCAAQHNSHLRIYHCLSFGRLLLLSFLLCSLIARFVSLSVCVRSAKWTQLLCLLSILYIF